MATARKPSTEAQLPITAEDLKRLTPQARDELLKQVRELDKEERERKREERAAERKASEERRNAAAAILEGAIRQAVTGEPAKPDYWLVSGRVTVDGQEYAAALRVNKR